MPPRPRQPGGYGARGSRAGRNRSAPRRPPPPKQELLEGFPEAGGSITALTPDKSNAWPGVWIVVDRRRVAKLSPKAVTDLNLKVGTPWTADLAETVADAATVGLAIRDAHFALSRRAMSRFDLGRRLARKGHERAAIDAALEELDRRGLLNDQVLAEQVVRSAIARRPTSRREMDHKLRQKGIAQDARQPVLDEAFAGRDPLADATELAQKRLSRMSAGLPAETIARRLFGVVARRGFPPDVCAQAVRTALAQRTLTLEDDACDTLGP